MSMIGKISKQIRQMFVGSKEQRVLALAQGFDNPFKFGATPDAYNGYGGDSVANYLRVDYDLMARYLDYESMMDYPMSATALDIYAADATQPDTPTNKRVWIESPDKDLQQSLNDWLHRTLRIEERLSKIAWGTCGYGNAFGELVVDTDGVIDIRLLPPATMRRIEGGKGEVYGYIQDFRRRVGFTPGDYARLLQQYAQRPNYDPSTSYGSVGTDEAIPFEPWQIVHFKLDNRAFSSVYGFAVTEPARWAWKRLVLMEDSALIYRLQRAPERYAFYCDVGNARGPEALGILNWYKQHFKKRRFVNRETNEVDMRFEALSPDEDLFLPTSGGQDSTRVEVLGAPAWQSVEDINYFRNIMEGALKIPATYLGQDDNTSKPTLSSQDVRFARTILNIQRELRLGIVRMTDIHLAALGIPPERVDYDVKMTVPSAIFELAQMEVRNARADLATRQKEIMSVPWILRSVYGMNSTEIDQILSEREDDAKREAVAMAKGAGAAAKFAPPQDGGGGGGFDFAHREPPKTPRLQERTSDDIKQLAELTRRSSKEATQRLDNLSRYIHENRRQTQQVAGLLSDLKVALGRTRQRG